MIQSKKKKADYDVQIKDIEGKYFTAFDYNKFTNNTLDVTLKKELVNKSNVSGFIITSDIINKTATLVTKAELKADQDKILKL